MSLLLLISLLTTILSYPNPPQWPDNIYVFTPDNANEAQTIVNEVFSKNGGQNPPDNGQWSTNRYGFLFTPGTYNIDVNIGYYTGLYGMGQTPSDVNIRNVIVEDGATDNTIGALDNFWRSAEGFTSNPTDTWFGNANSMLWAVSQAAPLRRAQINGNLLLFQYISGDIAGYASGGYMSDVKVTGTVTSGSQQQFYFRNCEFGKWAGGVWNMVFEGVKGAPASHCGNQGGLPITTLPTTPVIAEKPYIVYSGGLYSLFIPSIKYNSAGISNYNDGLKVDFSRVLVATINTPVNTINQALSSGNHVILCGGNYKYNSPIIISKSNTVVLGIGWPVIESGNGNIIIQINDGVYGTRVAGILLQAGKVKSPSLLQVGNTTSIGSGVNPNFIIDVFARVGGTNNPSDYQVMTTTMFQVNQGNAVIDDTWLWRADHGVAGSTVNSENPVSHGLVVNGGNTTAYGLACEHTLQDCIVWSGNNGRVTFYQCELPYDVTQSNYGNLGYSGANLVGNGFNGYGMGVYCFFEYNSVTVNSAIKAGSNVKLTNSLDVFLNGKGGINHVINNIGTSVNAAGEQQYVCSYP